jgi:Na+-transporting methylmalonyl-CoA/oxaloacetate decarboxylase gamma subunit
MWVRNSHNYSPLLDNEMHMSMYYSEIAICVAILVHSAFYHRKRYTESRIQTEVAAFCGALMASLELVAIAYNTPTVWAVVYDFICGGFLTVIVQVMDNLMFYTRLKAVTPISRPMSVLLFLYGVLFMYSWVPIYSIFPMFIDVDSLEFLPALIAIQTTSGWAAFAYNMGMVFVFSFILLRLFWRPMRTSVEFIGEVREGVPASVTNAAAYDAHKAQQRRKKVVTVIAVKSIIHGFASTMAHMLWAYFFFIANPMCNIIIIVSMHLLFNIRIETMVRDRDQLSSDEEEYRIFRGRSASAFRFCRALSALCAHLWRIISVNFCYELFFSEADFSDHGHDDPRVLANNGRGGNPVGTRAVSNNRRDQHARQGTTNGTSRGVVLHVAHNRGSHGSRSSFGVGMGTGTYTGVVVPHPSVNGSQHGSGARRQNTKGGSRSRSPAPGGPKK